MSGGSGERYEKNILRRPLAIRRWSRCEKKNEVWGSLICLTWSSEFYPCFLVFDFSYQKFKKRRVCTRRTRRGSWKGIRRGWEDRPWNLREPLSFHCCLSFYRLRVVPHLSSGIVQPAKRKRAWKSPHVVGRRYSLNPIRDWTIFSGLSS